MQQQQKKKTAKGEGYTIRLSGGKKVLKTALLEEQVATVQKAYNELIQENKLLRAKEAMQLELLDSYEVGLQHMGAVASQQHSSTPEHSMSLVSAALLDIQALELKQVLQLPAAATMVASTHSGQQQETACRPVLVQAPHSTLSTPGPKSAATSSASNSSGGSISMSGSDAPGEGSVSSSDHRMKRLLASITPADVLGLQGLSLQELAGRFRSSIGRLALARQALSHMRQTSADALTEAVEAFGKLCVLSLVSNEDRHCKLIGLNLETMQDEEPPAGLCAQVATKANLQQSQVEHIRRAYQCYNQQQVLLLQQQRSTMQQLQSTLGASALQAGTTRALQRLTSPGSLAALAPSAGPAHLLSLAASMTAPGAHSPVRGSAQCNAAAASTVPSVPAGIARAFRRDETLEATAAGSAGSTVTAQQLQLLPDLCRKVPADEGDAGSYSSSSSLLVPGVLSLESSEQAEMLLQDLMRISRALVQHARRLNTMLINQLDTVQHADAILEAYPFVLNIPALCAHVAKTAGANKAA